MPFSTDDPAVTFKLNFVRSAVPAASAVVFGDMYVVDGGYTKACLDLGIERVLLIDTLETPAWQRLRLENPTLDFYKGDFGDPHFMASVRETFEIGVLFDVFLHQPSLIGALHLMLEKVERDVLIVQPMLKEQATPQSLVYLPGNPDGSLHPMGRHDTQPDGTEYNVFDVAQVNHTHWIWGMTPSFLRSALAGEGFEVQVETTGSDLPNDRWFLWGCRARRTTGPIRKHWSTFGKEDGLYAAPW